MKNIDIAHNFFYNQTPRANANTHFINDRFYSCKAILKIMAT